MGGVTQADVGKRRVAGIDAARGAALVAMMAIHILPAWNEDFEPTLTWLLFAGRGAALFALLAGVSLALMSGGQYPPRGRKMTAVRYGLVVRAALVTVIGLLLGHLVIFAQVILVYYGVMFLLALPLLRLRVRTLLVLAAGIAVAAPVLMQASRDSLPDMLSVGPNFATLAEAPGGVLGQVLLSGAYPALPWMAYVCAGLAIGRLDLTERKVQLRLLVAGVGLAIAAAVLSALLMGPFGGRGRLLDSAGPSTVPVDDILIWGPDPVLPTDSWWWLASLSPYSSTPLVLVHTIGTSVAVLALLLLVGRSVAVQPLARLGKMTLTLYSLHLILLATGILADNPPLELILQLAILGVFASLWQRYRQQGPLEWAVAEASKRARNKYLESTGHPGKPGSAGGRASHRAPVAGELRQGRQPTVLPTVQPPPAHPPAPSVPGTAAGEGRDQPSDAPPSRRLAARADGRAKHRQRG